MAKLTALKVERAAQGAKLCDGSGLWLIVSPRGAKKWALRFQMNKRAREMGLGSFPEVTLAGAREQALAARRMARSGMDPIDARQRDRANPTFGWIADEVLTALPRDLSAKHRHQWERSLKVEAANLRAKLVDQITTEEVLRVLKPLWTETNETASRLRGRIERVLDAAKARGFRTGDNPAAWRGHLDHLLPRRGKLDKAHHAAMDYADVPAFLARLHARDTVGALALEFCILTAARAGEVLGARWSEIDIDTGVWTIPAERMKARVEHRVPLSDRAVEILNKVKPLQTGEFVFPGQHPSKPCSHITLRHQLQVLGVEGATVHGFRSSFRDWCGNETNTPREVAEAALAHSVGSAVEAAYRRSDALEKRRGLMEAWAQHCEPRGTDAAKIIALNARRA